MGYCADNKLLKYEFENLKNDIERGDIYYASDKIAVIPDASGCVTTHIHDYYEMIYVADGEGNEVINGRRYEIKKGDIVFMNLNDVHYSYSKNMCVINVCFKADDMLDYRIATFEGGYPKLTHLDVDMQEELEMLIHLLKTDTRKKYEFKDEASKHYFGLMMIFLKRCGYIAADDDKRFGKIIAYIAENFKTVTLDEAAEKIYLTKTYFCRLFKEKFGVTFLEYVNGIKIKAAIKMISDTDMPIGEIWSCVGFKQAKQFYSEFKKATGQTPVQFRNRNGI